MIGGDLLFAGSGYWYLYALPLYFLVTKLTLNQPAWLVLSPALLLACTRESVSEVFRNLLAGLSDGSTLLGSVAGYFAFFLLGARAARLRELLSCSEPGVSLVVFAPLFLGTCALSVVAVERGNPWASTLAVIASLFSIAFGVSLARMASRVNLIARVGRYIGSRTLSVYAAHFFAVSALSLAWARLEGFLSGYGAWAAYVLPVPIVGLIVGIALVLRVVASRVGMAFLFEPPGWVAGRRDRRLLA
jgi:fucose 4-O-acetylase-like acetyltransferase